MDDAIGIAQEFQRTHPDTLIVVSADHSHTSPDHRPDHGPARPVHDAADRRRRADPHRLRHRPRSPARSPTPARPSRSSPRARAPPTSTGTIDQTELFPVLTNTQTGSGPATSTPVGGDVGGAVPATLALTVGGPAAFPAFDAGRGPRLHRGADRQRHLHRPASRRSSVADAEHERPRPARERRVLPRHAAPGPGEGRRVRGGRRRRRSTCSTYTGPVSNDAVPIEFKQSIAANEALRTGTYGKTLTLTLSTTTP